VSLPSIARGPRYRPGLGWEGTPEWYGAPGAEVESGAGGYGSAGTSAVGSGSSHRGEALTGTIVPTAETGETGEAGKSSEAGEPDDGGSSARW
jgi:hypothetical protein